MTFNRKDVFLTRVVLFFISYGLFVISITQCILYLNYRTLGYSWYAVIRFILQTTELYIALGSILIMISVIYSFDLSRSSSS